ncbi:dipeptidase [Candidatus Poriferisodalis sp.]|uniref:dipeptidase n=1 Tax=Candidatus Poriferisodalis sp. TaxID=3101277 RepID=UPI003B0296F2
MSLGETRVADSHNDLLLAVLHQRERGHADPFGDYWLPELRAGGVDLQFLPIFTEDQHVGEGALRRALLLLEQARHLADVHAADVAIVETRDELQQALASNRIALLLALEGSEPLGADLALLETFFRLGVRCMSLTWNRRTMMADGVGEAATGAGLAALGIDAVAEMERLGMVVDVSHLSAAGVRHVADIATRPFVATHSSCHALCPHPRNLTDGQMRQIAASGGVIGINAFGGFLAHESPTVADYLSHISHAIGVVGDAAVGLGPDFIDDLLHTIDPILGAGLVDPDCLPLVDGMRSPSDLGPLVEVLSAKLGPEIAGHVAGGNWIDFVLHSLPSRQALEVAENRTAEAACV